MFLTNIMKHLQTLNFALHGTEKIMSDLAQTVFSFQTTIKIFQRDINLKTVCYFFNLKTTVDEISKVMTEHKVKEYKDNLQRLWEKFQSKFGDFQELKPYFTFLVNSFDIDVINDGCPVRQPFATNMPTAEMELIEMQKDLALKNFNKCHSTVEFWQQVTECNYPELKKISVRLLSVFSTTYCLNLYSLQ